eukprot:1881080-Pyramimonas_sp.AAC.1
MRRAHASAATPEIRRSQKIGAGDFLPVSASGGPRRASGASKNGSGRKTGPGEVVWTSGPTLCLGLWLSVELAMEPPNV